MFSSDVTDSVEVSNVPTFSPKQPRERWQRKGTSIKLKVSSRMSADRNVNFSWLFLFNSAQACSEMVNFVSRKFHHNKDFHVCLVLFDGRIIDLFVI